MTTREPLHARRDSAFPRPRTAFRVRLCSGKRTDLDVPECDRELLVLQPDLPFREFRVMNVERGLAVQFDDEMVAVRRDLIAIPLIGLERVLARGLRGSDNSAGIVASRLLSPDLHFIAA